MCYRVCIKPFPSDPAAGLHAYNGHGYLYLLREMKSFALLKKANMGTMGIVEEHY